MKKQRVVLACQVFYPDAQSTSQLFTQLFEELAQKPDLELSVICGYPSAIRVGTGPMAKRETWKGIAIHRCGLQVDVKRSMLTRMLSYASFMTQTFWKLLWAPRDAIIVGVTNPPFMAVLLYLVSRLRRIRYQYNLQDMYPEGLYLSGVMKPRLMGKIWEWLNGKAYRRAEKLILLGRDMASRITERYGVRPEKLAYIPHWSVLETSVPTPFEGNALGEKLHLMDKFVVQYSGNMGLWHDMETLVRAAAAMKDEPGVRFLFIGDGRRRKAAEQLAKELGADNILWRNFVPKEELHVSLGCCHVSLVSLREGLEGIAVPCKIYGILASSRPIIAQVPANSEVAMMVKEEKCGVVIEPGDVEGIVRAVRGMQQDKLSARQMGDRGFAAYQEKYTLQAAVESFHRLWTTAQAAAPVTQS